MHFTQATDYAFRIVLHLAARPRAEVVSGQELARAEGVPVQFLRKVMRFLSHAGLVRSHRGAEGGFVLARPPAQISLLQVAEAVEGPLELSRCLLSDAACTAGCTRVCPVHEALRGVQQTLRDSLGALDFAALVRRKEEKERQERGHE